MWPGMMFLNSCGLKKLQGTMASTLEINTKNMLLKSMVLCIFFFLPTSRKVLPTFQTFCPVGVHFAQMVVDFAHFQVQARKRGVLGCGWRCFVYPRKGFVTAE